MKTARDIGAISCQTCDFLVMPDQLEKDPRHCPRCHADIHSRKKDSISRTWALLIASAVLLIPANFYPILTLVSLGEKTSETIMSGIITLFVTGQWAIGVVVFVASVFVPIFKVVALAFLLLSVQIHADWFPARRTALYRFVEFIGRWSMIDIFMISILTAIVKFQALATVQAELGAVAFAAVVILTMLAAHSFDPRLIWDRLGKEKNDRE
ncbi:MAG: paraquat-inducible protein A [Sneathiellales bacterium]|nr:paraquat-inducible protein A [Sneathiellales bacterium]